MRDLTMPLLDKERGRKWDLSFMEQLNFPFSPNAESTSLPANHSPRRRRKKKTLRKYKYNPLKNGQEMEASAGDAPADVTVKSEKMTHNCAMG